MRLRRFNKQDGIKKLHHKQNREINTKKRTIVLSVFILLFGIMYLTFAIYESRSTHSLINAKVGDFSGDVRITAYMYDDGSGSVASHDVPPANDGSYKINSVSCTNGDGSWDDQRWGLVIVNLTGKAKCNISFTKLIQASQISTSTEGKNLQQAIDDLAAAFN